MGILRTDKISGLETPTAVTGSVVFDGDGDFLTLVDSGDWDHKQKFTWETWIYLNSYDTSGALIVEQRSNGGSTGVQWYINTSNEIIFNQNASTSLVSATNTFTTGVWHHLAVCHDGSTIRIFMDGVLANSASTSTVPDNVSEPLRIGRVDGYTTFDLNGYLSNLRFVNGTALYTADFTPPTHELEKIGDTVLLCCNNPDSAGAEATGKTITVNGDAAASTFSPGLTRDFTFGTQFEGVAKFDTQGYFVPPSGTTEQRGRGRGVFGGGYAPTNVNTIQFVNIQSQGTAQDFGDLNMLSRGVASCSSSSRGLFAGGAGGTPTGSTFQDIIDYVTIATTGNATDFGNLTEPRRNTYGCSSSTRGVFGGGNPGSSPNRTSQIQTVILSSLGDAVDFGDLTGDRTDASSASSPTRGVFGGGSAATGIGNIVNTIDFITIASGGTASDFGDLTQARSQGGSLSSSTRAIFAGGDLETPASNTDTNTIDYITIASTGNAQDFGDLTLNGSTGAENHRGVSNNTRGVFGGGYQPGVVNNIEFIIIASTGNSQDFGDLMQKVSQPGACSDSHGGLS